MRRASKHPAATSLVLRGSLVTRALCGQGRPAADVDYLISGPFDAVRLAEFATEIARLPDDRVIMDVVSTDVIWAETAFPGLRVQLLGQDLRGDAQMFQVDFAYGDPLGQPPALLRIPEVGPVLACQAETLWAWKLHGLVEFGPGRWRAKDLYDLHLLGTRVALNHHLLPALVALAFRSRDTALDTLDDVRTRAAWGMSSSNARKWRAFQRTYGVDLDVLEARQSVRVQLERLLPALLLQELRVEAQIK
ncbi:nucleotidyl transferase AbiEii/AbiGii toxin family protein [Deinococcus ruber]|uniref:Nucleotidyltransferase n=1 Tax=Deinococcus ruber TaxID=1848197 RepID=A0A918C3T6_9DEIO|nr:nucleotidyl transferase AbiEii/AbiGii toxin family protein [Deinococcus ruber]GGR03711.1 hypothetical protein GCM10008957_15790 [Deinococcus ruber]